MLVTGVGHLFYVDVWSEAGGTVKLYDRLVYHILQLNESAQVAHLIRKVIFRPHLENSEHHKHN